METKIPIVTNVEEWNKKQQRHPYQANHLAMYSSWADAITRDPTCMQIPLDDHMVHRGDGVFEAVKAINGRIFLLREHVDRLFRSLEMINLRSPISKENLHVVIKQVAQASGSKNLLIRVYISRGPGGFGVDPKESLAPQLYVVAAELKTLKEDLYTQGVTATIAENALKPGFWSQVKSCNYLPNVMMKDLANQRGVFLSLSKTIDEYFAEGSTENLLVHSANGELVYPPFDYTLRGTTLVRLIELAKAQGIAGVTAIHQRPVSVAEGLSAQQIMVIGTTLDVLSVVKIDNRPIGDGKVSMVAKGLRQMLKDDFLSDSGSMTAF